ncbi:protein translocase subunit SecD [Clostridium chauvoei]|uniref:Protein translocase subunit SecD n=2 Tax=Clostridium chauvoei TaxID=46867 RepID=A0A1U6JH67_9CLOT|nr:protein translocase subunit SecD [Clostridium chauvoei]ATD55343.1 protein-export membrane protein SecD [Clostridium chauvoei]ATD56983.1 protein-export membrane protein SecD [Clostridium chauvoei]MBX7280855.1 protein translocase subunit SecD [Clostridium chauvoei]MBX7283338.1 protein translocase subunit SecD [Clostridium chauvoei]MBX7285812.1 protein translocase subunit SecD [Clostridium chauvoei]
MKAKGKSKSKSSIILVLCVIAIFSLAFAGFKGFKVAGWEFKSFDKVITKGLDLQGGVSVLMEIQEENISRDDLEKTRQLLELRVNKLGVAETTVATEGDKRIRVDIPGKFDSNEIVDSLGKTGNLTFKDPEGNVVLTGKDVKEATAMLDNQTNKPVVSLKLNEDGQKKFADATSKNIGKQISISMDEEVISSPKVQNAITDGNAIITGSSTIDEAKNLSGLINSGALPVSIKAVSVKNVGAQLGAEALPNAMKAGVVGIALIFIFMIVYYRLPGLLSSIALTLYITLVLLIFVEVGATLTLPGIAGFLLTIGMAVDANVLIFERIREELAKGISIKSAVKKGFENALSSIVDSNITTIIAALVLYFIGSGAVKGFAVTLMIGILVSMFTALVVTKLLVNLAVEMGLLKDTRQFRVKRGAKNA